jgi:3',5'-cyclic AMP phosphodiesterase CpdA
MRRHAGSRPRRDTVTCAVAICASVLVGGVGSRGPDRASAPAPGRGFTIAVATDIHYLAPELRDNGKAFRAFEASGDGRLLGDVDEIVRAFARDVRRLAPDALVISGDLTNNGERQSHLALAQKLAGVENASGTRVFVVPGNHDVMNPWARRFEGRNQVRVDSVTRDEFRTIYGRFGYDEAISSDPSSLSYLAAPSGGVWLLMLDTSVYRFNRLTGRPSAQGVLANGTLEWIRQCAGRAKERRARVITVMHHNLVDHSELLHGGFTLDNGDDVRRLFQALGLDVVLSGHLHVQDIRRIDDGPTPVFDIATSSLSVYPQQYGVLEQLPSGALDYRTSRVDVEGWAREEGGTRKQLRAFRAYSEARFRRASYEKTYAALAATGLYSNRDKKLMAETMSRLNASYFAGTAWEVRDEVMASEGFRLWTAATEPVFLTRYVLGMIPRTAADHTRVRIPPPAGLTD